MTNQNNSEQKSVGPTIGLVVILIVIILGGIYFWNDRKTNNTGNPSEQTNESDQIEEIQNQNSSDEINIIEEDLQGFNEVQIDTIDADLQ